MKKLIKAIFGIEATAKNIRGRKSSGSEDLLGFKNWRKDFLSGGIGSIN